MIFCSYDGQGRVLFHGDVPESMIELQDGNIYAGEVNPFTHYIVNGEPIERPPSNVRIDNNETLQDIPIGAEIHINDQTYTATESVCTIDFTYPGVYKIKIVSFPFLDFETEVIK